MSSDNISIRELSEADIAAADLLRQKAGWNQTHADWLRTIRYEPRGCFAAVRGDEIVGTVTTTTYGTALGWIGMMHASSQRRQPRPSPQPAVGKPANR